VKSLAGKGPVRRDWFGLESFQPGPRFTRDGSRLFLLEEVGSTNDFLLGRGDSAKGRICVLNEWGWSVQDQAILEPPARVEHGLVAVARRQSAGKGRQGRTWADCGGLNFSVVVPSHQAAFEKGFSVWLGLMVVLTLREEFSVDARLKWPNDIMCGGRKLGGLLLENRAFGPDTAIVAGLGLNLDTSAEGFPAQLQGNATSIFIETGRVLRPASLAGRLLARIENEIDRFHISGWTPWQHALSCLDCLLGREVVLAHGEKRISGRACGIDQGGNLLLDEGDGHQRAYSAGEIHILSSQRAGSQEDGP